MKFFVILQILGLVFFVNSGHLPQQPAKNEDDNAIHGLYDDNDRVMTVTNANVKENIYDRPHATMLQFYNSFCGHCRRFAPHYKSIARDIYNWRNVLKVMAIDCAVDDNNDICREYEVMGYPSVRYFSPNQKNGLGRTINDQDEEFIKGYLMSAIVNETDTSNISNWPHFSHLDDENRNKLFENCPENVKFAFIIFEPENSTLGVNLILEFSILDEIKIRRTISNSVASHFNIDSYSTLALIDRNLNIETVSVTSGEYQSYTGTMKNILSLKHIKYTSDTHDKNSNLHRTGADRISGSHSDLLNEVLENKHVVYQADLEIALRYAIFHEMAKYSVIDGEKLIAAQRFLNVVVKYNPLGRNGQSFLEDLQNFVRMHNQELRGEQYEAKVDELEKKHFPVFSSSKWVGCQPSKPNLRGYSCGLWQLFHFLTVQAALDETATNPLEVLHAIHGYVKNYFGCTECSTHFQAMAARRKIWSTSSKEDAVLWLWSAHNEVNKRLAGDSTEDPSFPKIQFPIREICYECIKDQSSTSNGPSNEINWHRIEVLQFLKRLHSFQNISRLGVDDENVLPPAGEKPRAKRMVASVFSDIDMRMGILLYVFCIAMMIVAVKLFLRKGYRKKAYSYDFFGKV